MIFGSLVLILSATGLLVGGLVLGSNLLLGGSIVASVFAALVLYIGARQRAAARTRGADHVGGWDDLPQGDAAPRDEFRSYPDERQYRERERFGEPGDYRGSAEHHEPGEYHEPDEHHSGRYDQADEFEEPKGFEEHGHLEKQGRFDDLRASYEQAAHPDGAGHLDSASAPAWQGVHTEQPPGHPDQSRASFDAALPPVPAEDDFTVARRDEDLPPGSAGFGDARTPVAGPGYGDERGYGDDPGYGSDPAENGRYGPTQAPERTDEPTLVSPPLSEARSLPEPPDESDVSTGKYERTSSLAPEPDDAPAPVPQAEDWVGGGSEADDPKDEPPIERRPAQVVVAVARLDNDVFVIDGRPRYHLGGCVHLLGREAESLPVYEAVDLGFTPCSLCEPDTVLVKNAKQAARH